MPSADDPRVKKLLTFKSLRRDDLAVLVVTGTDRGDGLEAERDKAEGKLKELLVAVEKQQQFTRMCVEGPLNTQLRDLYLLANETRVALLDQPPSRPQGDES